MKPTDFPLLRKSSDLEDEVYLQMDKVLALCGMLSIADSNECDLPLGLRSNYSVVLEEQALALRKLLDRVFEQGRTIQGTADLQRPECRR